MVRTSKQNAYKSQKKCASLLVSAFNSSKQDEIKKKKKATQQCSGGLKRGAWKTETYTQKGELRLIPCIIPVTIGRVLYRGSPNPISTREKSSAKASGCTTTHCSNTLRSHNTLARSFSFPTHTHIYSPRRTHSQLDNVPEPKRGKASLERKYVHTEARTHAQGHVWSLLEYTQTRKLKQSQTWQGFCQRLATISFF